MTLSMDQFHEVYFAESFELLDAMEAALLRLTPGAADIETVNTIFRVAHSIKGGAGMFGFAAISSFTHTLETLLDELRCGRLQVTAPICEGLLQSVDVIRSMLSAQQKQQALDEVTAQRLQRQLGDLAVGGADTQVSAPNADVPPVATPAAAQAAAQAPAQVRSRPVAAPPALTCWHIRFVALPGLLARGIDPVRLFEDLAGLGELLVQADLGDVPPLESLDPTHCRIRWHLTLLTSMPRPSIEMIFDWAEGDCELSIERVVEPGIAEQAPQTEAQAAKALASESAPATAIAPTTQPATATATATATVSATATDNATASASPSASAVPAPAPAPAAEVNSIRVGIDKVDDLLNVVGEVVITQSMLAQLVREFEGPQADRLRSGLAQLESHVRQLQETVMRVRMLPVSSVFSRFPRLVRDLSTRLGKQIRLQLSGEQTELDKTVLEKIGDPLVHLIRNSIDHGIEPPAERVAAGKPAEGLIHLHAFHKGGNIKLVVSDDGRGLHRERLLQRARERGLISETAVLSEEQVHELIFTPGFSTAATTTDLSGRGVGMDVVRRNIKELGGSVALSSEAGVGTTITITLPLTLAIVDGQSVRVGDETYIVPLVAIIESLQLREHGVQEVFGRGEVFQFRGEHLPVIRLHEVFDIAPSSHSLTDGLLMVVEGDGRRAGLFIDELLGQQQVVIKSLETHYTRIPGVGGATILGEGMVALILDVAGLLRLHATRPAQRRTGT